MKNICYYLLFSLCLLFSCTSRYRDKEKTIHENIFCQSIGGDDYLLGAPNSMALYDSILAIVDTRSDSLVHFFNTHSGKYLCKAGLRGQGPGEFTMITSLNSCERDSFSFYDPNKRTLYYAHYTSNGVVMTPAFNIDSLLHFEVRPVIGEHFLATGIYENNRYCMIDRHGDVTQTFGEWPYRDETERKVSGHVKSEAYMSGIVVSPFGTKFLSYTITADILTFYQIKDGVASLVKESCLTYPDYHYENNPDSYSGISRKTPIAYLAASCTEKYVYLLFSGRNLHENDLQAFRGNIIYVYSWEGDKIAELKSDKDLQCLCVSHDEKSLYAIALDPEPILVQMALPQLNVVGKM